jgi:pilus assembly protein Flp/PilA
VVEFFVKQAVSLRDVLADVLRRDEEGQDMIEYALLAALISIVAIVMILAIGPYIQNTFKDVANALAST